MKLLIEKRNYLILGIIVLLVIWILFNLFSKREVYMDSFDYFGESITIKVYDKVNQNNLSEDINKILKGYEDGEKEVLYLESIPWQNNLIKEEGIYIPVRNLGITFILVIILILNIIGMRRKFKRNENQLIEKNISIMITTVLTLMILCNFILGLTTPFLMIPILAIFIFGGAGVIGLISYYIERKKMRRKSSSEFFKSLLLNYVLLLMIYMIVWAGNSVMELNIFMSILLVAGETILGYIIGRMIDIPNYKKM